jgi:hypothetical protein
MFMKPLEAGQSWTTYVLSTLLESWSASRASGTSPLPALIELAHKHGISSITAVAYGSVFGLAEACLGRPLSVKRCCSDELPAGEWALIHMLDGQLQEGDAAALAAKSGEMFDTLLTAATSARRLLAPPEHELDRLWNTTHAARLWH